jgi:hypothetical protein
VHGERRVQRLLIFRANTSLTHEPVVYRIKDVRINW